MNLQEELLETKEWGVAKLEIERHINCAKLQEIRSVSEVIKSVPEKSALCVERSKTVVWSAISEDDGSRNLVINGLKENDEPLSEKVSSLFEKLGGIKPCVEVCRIGKKNWWENYQTGESTIFELINS